MTELMSKITNEQTLANCFHGDHWIGAAERDYYLKEDHEICLCASLNRRIPGRYGFICLSETAIPQNRKNAMHSYAKDIHSTLDRHKTCRQAIVKDETAKQRRLGVLGNRLAVC